MSNPNNKHNRNNMSNNTNPNSLSKVETTTPEVSQEQAQQATALETKEAPDTTVLAPEDLGTQDTVTKATETPAAKATENPVPSIQPLQAPKAAEPVLAQRRPQTHVSVGTLKAVPESIDADDVMGNLEGKTHIQSLAHMLGLLENKLSRRTQSSADEAAKQMLGVYSLLLNTINGNKPISQFQEEWSYIVAFFKKHEKEGVGASRIFRGVAYWTKSQDEFVHFQSLVNLITVTHSVERNLWSKSINFNKVTKGLTEAGRGRLLSYYL